MQGLQLVGVPRFELGTSSPPDRAGGGDARRRPTPIAVTKRVCRASRVSRPAWLRERVRGRLGQDWATVLVGAPEPVHPSTEPRGGTMESENGHMTKVERDELAKLVRRPREAREGPTPTASPPTGSLTSRSSSPASTSQPTTRSGGTHEEAAKIVANAAKQIAERCRALQHPGELQARADGELVRARRERERLRRGELRAVAKTRIDGDAKAAKVAIERSSVDIQTSSSPAAWSRRRRVPSSPRCRPPRP